MKGRSGCVATVYLAIGAKIVAADHSHDGSFQWHIPSAGESKRIELVFMRQNEISYGKVNFKGAKILSILSHNGWGVCSVQPRSADRGYLNFRGIPCDRTDVTYFSGAFRRDEEATTEKWLIKAAMGIPKRRVAYLAWHVSKGLGA